MNHECALKKKGKFQVWNWENRVWIENLIKKIGNVIKYPLIMFENRKIDVIKTLIKPNEALL